MLIICLTKEYNLKWIQKQFNRNLCVFKYEKFPVDKLHRNDWIGIHIGGKILFVGQFQQAIQILNSQKYRVYLTSLIGFNPIKFSIISVYRYVFANISVRNINGRHTVKINNDVRVVPNVPKYKTNGANKKPFFSRKVNI